MVTMRLQRRGSVHRPFYHIVVADSRRCRDGKFIEKIGYYDPNMNPSTMEIKADRVTFWYTKGAQVSDTVKKIIKCKNIPLSRKP